MISSWFSIAEILLLSDNLIFFAEKYEMFEHPFYQQLNRKGYQN
jgi:hypothetical protein